MKHGGNDPRFKKELYEKIDKIMEGKEDKLIKAFYVNPKFLLPDDSHYFIRLGHEYHEMERLFSYGYPIYAVKDQKEDVMVEYVELSHPIIKEENVK